MKKLSFLTIILLCSFTLWGQNINGLKSDVRIFYKRALLIPQESVFEGVFGLAKMDKNKTEESFFVVNLETASIKGKKEKETTFLQSENFLFATHWHSLNFSSSEISTLENGLFLAKAELEINNLKTPVDWIFEYNEDESTLSGTFKVNRELLNIGENVSVLRMSKKLKFKLVLSLD